MTRRRPSSAFTLVELVVVLVVMTVVASLAVPTFSTLVERSTDARNEATLVAVMRAAASSSQLVGTAAFDAQAFTDVVLDEMSINALAVGLAASDAWELVVDEAGVFRWSDRYGQLHLAFSADGTQAGLAMESRDDASCVFATGSTSGAVSWTVAEHLQAACSARFAIGDFAEGIAIPSPLAPGAIAPPVTPVVSATGGDRTITVTWSAVDDSTIPVDAYSVYVTIGAAQVPVGAPVTHETGGSWSVTTPATLTNGVSYDVAVVATNVNGESTGTASATPVDVTAPPVPAPTAVVNADSEGLYAVVSWPAVAASDLAGYTVAVDGEQVTTLAVADPRSWQVDGLVPGQAVVVSVRSFDDENPANVSGPGTVSVTAAEETPVVTATVDSATEIALSWTAVAGATGYRIENGSGATLATLGSATTSWDHTGLAAGTTYSYQVFATNADWTSGAGSVSATTLPAEPASTVTALSSSAVRVSWTAVAGATGYRIENGSGATLATLGSATTSWDHTGLAAGTTYSYQVFATNASGSSTATLRSVATIPATPTVAHNCPVSGSTITGLCTPTWSAVTGATSYSVTAVGQSTTTYTTASTTGTALQASIGSADSLAAGFLVSACNASGCSAGGAAGVLAAAPAPATVGIGWGPGRVGDGVGPWNTAYMSSAWAMAFEVETYHGGGWVYCSDVYNGVRPDGSAFPRGCTDGSGNWTARWLPTAGFYTMQLHTFSERTDGGTFGGWPDGQRGVSVTPADPPVFGLRHSARAYGINTYHPVGWTTYGASVTATW